MLDTPVPLLQKPPSVLKLLLIIESDRALGNMLVQTIKRETPYQAILATGIVEACHILEHLKCDLILLADSLLPLFEEFSTSLHTLPTCEKIAIYFFPATVLREQALLPNQAGAFERDRLLQTIQHLLNASGNTSSLWREVCV